MSVEHPHGATVPYLAHYRELIDRVGAVFEATGWRSREFQEERFRVMAEMEDFSGLTVIDAGAGQADFAAFLIERGEMPARMIALDAMPEMVEAIKHRGMNGVEAHVCDFAGADCDDAFTQFGDVDSVVFSGSLNTLDEKLARSVLERAWEAVGRSLVFNFLSDRAPAELLVKPTEPAHRFDTAGMVEWALERTAGVWFRHDYLGGHDATIAMVKAGG